MKLSRPGSSPPKLDSTAAASGPSRDRDAKALDSDDLRLDILSALKRGRESGRTAEPAGREAQAIRLDAFRQRFDTLIGNVAGVVVTSPENLRLALPEYLLFYSNADKTSGFLNTLLDKTT